MISRISFDLHTHTFYSHGKGGIVDNASMAAGRGHQRLGISDHGPGSLTYGIKLSAVDAMRKDIGRAKALYPDLEISLGVEANIANPDGTLDISKEDQKLFDYIIAGYHYSYLGNAWMRGIGVVLGGWAHERGFTTSQTARAYNTDFVLSSLYENDIYILSHPGDKADFDIDAIAKACEQTDTIMEINSRHHGLTVEGIKTAMEYDVKFILSSDAHTPGAVGNVETAWKRAVEAGLQPSRIINLREEEQWNL